MNASHRSPRASGQVVAPYPSKAASEGTQSAVRVLRLCNSRHAHVALVPMPWRNR